MQQVGEDDPLIWRVLWFLLEAIHATDDGYHFLPCPDCKPTDRLVVLARKLVGAK